jgi:hypothetical protein
MKNKHQGLAGLIIFALTVAGMLVYGVYLANNMTGSIHMPGPVKIPEIKVPNASTMAYINFLVPRLTDLATLKKTTARVDLKLFGFNAALSDERGIKKHQPMTLIPVSSQEASKEVRFSYALTLCFASLKNRFCAIDGKLYKEEGVLTDGGKILKIENDRVLILRHHKKEWIYPLNQQNISKEKQEETI